MEFIAHRGLYNETIGENTFSAFDNAFSNAYIGIELDVRKTKDNKVVVIHDSFISRVSDGIGLVKNKTYNELLKYNFGKKYLERIPLFQDVINKYYDKIFIIELKDKINIEELNLNDKNTYYISSFNNDYLRNIPVSNKYKKGVISYGLNNPSNLEDLDFIMILDSFISDKIYEYYYKKGIEVMIYGVGKKINLNLSEKYRKNIKYII